VRGLRSTAGFTLIELIVAMTVVSVMSIFLFRALEGTNDIWRRSTAKVENFRAARNAFDSMVRRVSEATLNTYWDYEYTGSSTTPTRYARQSDLRFICGAAQSLCGTTTPPRPGHAIFFQAPLGEVDSPTFDGLGNLLNNCGYYLEFNSDAAERPPFINAITPPIPERYRYRMMEVRQAANRFDLYSLTSGNLAYTSRDWIKKLVSGTPNTTPPVTPPVHVLAENVIALVCLPKLALNEDPTGTLLAPGYDYDSTVKKTNPKVNPKNQLPPLVQVTLVALDETTAARLANGSTPPPFGLESLFTSGQPTSAARYTDDLQKLVDTLNARRLSHRVFTTNIAIRGAKWSRD
jgi:uncharacterized protein (TIGR02599 family)